MKNYFLPFIILVTIFTPIHAQTHLLAQKERKTVTNKKKTIDSIIYFDDAFEFSKQTKDLDHLKKVGFKYQKYLRQNLKNYVKCRIIIEQLITECTAVDNRSCISNAYYEMAILLRTQDSLIPALKAINKSVSLLDNKTSKLEVWRYYSLRGDIVSMFDTDQSLKDFRKAKDHLSEKNSSFEKGYTYRRLVDLLPYKQVDSVFYYSKKQKEFQKIKKGSQEDLDFYNNLADVLLMNDRPKEALELINKHLDWCEFDINFEKCNDPYFLHTFGAIEQRLGNYTSAIKKLEYVKKKYLELKDYGSLVELAQDISKTYELQGNLSASLRELKPIKSLMDSIAVTTARIEMQRAESRKLLKEKIKKIKTLETQKSKISTNFDRLKYFAFGLILVLIAVLFLMTFLNFKNKFRHLRLQQKLNLNRLNTLQSAMSPHFLFNCFSTLQNYILKNEIHLANEYMTQLSRLIRNILSSSETISTTFNKEIEILQTYTKLNQGKICKEIIIEYDISKELIEKDPFIPSMILQPYIENCFVHAFNEDHENCKILLSFHCLNKSVLICKIKDNGIGRVASQIHKKSQGASNNLSIATKNVSERLAIFKDFGYETSGVTTKDLYDANGNSCGTEVTILLPIVEGIKDNFFNNKKTPFND